jgi:hypothetical protein
MKATFAFATTVLAASALAFTTTKAHAEAWRCVDGPDLPECQDALINDIEAIVDGDWPDVLTLPMPSLPYTCNKKPGGGHRFAATAATPAFSHQLNWSIRVEVASNRRSFLIGQHEAAASLSGTVTPIAWWNPRTTWTGTGISYAFRESSNEVLAPSGPTGVTDLGTFRTTVVSGDFWSGDLRIRLDNLADGAWDCVVGPSGKQVRKSGNTIVTLDYPMSWTPMQAVIAEGIREQFRRAVRIAVTGEP